MGGKRFLLVFGLLGGVTSGLLTLALLDALDPGHFRPLLFPAVVAINVVGYSLGGWLTFLGPMLGAAVIVSLRTFVSGVTDYWTLILGILLVLVILFLPEGLLGYVFEIWKRRTSESAEG